MNYLIFQTCFFLLVNWYLLKTEIIQFSAILPSLHPPQHSKHYLWNQTLISPLIPDSLYLDSNLESCRGFLSHLPMCSALSAAFAHSKMQILLMYSAWQAEFDFFNHGKMFLKILNFLSISGNISHIQNSTSEKPKEPPWPGIWIPQE